MENFIKKDKNGNILRVENNEVTLKLSSHSKTKHIGHFDSNDNLIKGYRKLLEESIHKFRKKNGWGINYAIVHSMQLDRFVEFRTDVGYFRISVLDIKNYGEIQQFSLKAGQELQYIVKQELMLKKDSSGEFVKQQINDSQYKPIETFVFKKIEKTETNNEQLTIF